MGGSEAWEKLAQYGLPFLPEGIISIAFGLAAAVVEGVGGLFLIFGFYHRMTCLAHAGTMAVAFCTKLDGVTGIGDFAKAAGWPLELLIVFIALFLMGAGRLRVGKRIKPKQGRVASPRQPFAHELSKPRHKIPIYNLADERCSRRKLPTYTLRPLNNSHFSTYPLPLAIWHTT